MTAVREYVLHCDYGGCSDWHRFVATTVASARKQAHKEGWRHRKVETYGSRITKDYCPRPEP